MKCGNLAFWLSGFLALEGCDDGSSTPVHRAEAASAVETSPRFSPAAVEAAKAAIAAEPKVKDLLFDEGKYGVEWQVAVISDGKPRHGYADYICQLLAQNQAIDPNVEVRIVDAVMVEGGRDFRSASLGTVRCSDGTRLDQAPAVSG